MDLSIIERKKKEIEKLKRNYYVIDTNVFVDCPNIISKIDNNNMVVLSAKVIDELDKLKVTLNDSKKKNVESALRMINLSMEQENVSMTLSNPDLLPSDFNKKAPDNNILSVAIKFKLENPILLT